jgi:hypothetical protein
VTGELPTCWKTSMPTARLRHRCCECRGVIEPGERYHLDSGVWDGEGQSFKTCMQCDEIRTKEQRGMNGDCLAFGCLLEYVVDLGQLPLLDRCIEIANRRSSWDVAADLRRWRREWTEVES